MQLNSDIALHSGSAPLSAPSPEPLADDILRIHKMTQLLPRLERLPIPAARALYSSAALLFCPRVGTQARMKKLTAYPRLLAFEPQTKVRQPGAHLFLHGGGWALGSASCYSSYCAWLSAVTHKVLYALDYRLAPEHPYPAALDDCLAAYLYLRKSLGPDEPLYLVGDSAGAQLSLALSYRLRSLNEKLPSALLLYYPVLDIPGQTASYQTFAEGPFLSKALMERLWRLYSPPEDQEEGLPLRWKNFAWLPPVSLCLARHDVLFDEGFALAQSLREAGVLQSLHIAADLPHAYISFMRCPSVMAALQRQAESFNRRKE